MSAVSIRGLDIAYQRARQIQPDDCENFDYMLTMDEEDYRAVVAERKTSETPYYGGPEGFERVLETGSKGGFGGTP